jgi:hypothetical protein
MVWLGKISYPLYLWHWPLLSFLRISSGGESPVSARLAAICIAVALAWLTYVVVERPIRFGVGRENWVPRLSAALVAIAAIGLVDVGAAGFPARIPEPLRDYVSTEFDLGAGARGGQCWINWNAPPESYAPDCYRTLHPGERSVLVWGDSHAGRLYVGIAASLGSSVNVRQMTRDDCAPLLDVSPYRLCNESNAFAIAMMAKYRPDVVVMYAAWTFYGPFTPGSIWARSLLKTLAQAHAAGVKNVVVVGSPPIWTDDLPSLLAKRWRAAPYAGVPAIMKDGLTPQPFVIDKQMRSLLAHTSATYVSLTAPLCSAAGCRTLVNTGPEGLMTPDYGHFTKAGALYVMQFLPLRQMLSE